MERGREHSVGEEWCIETTPYPPPPWRLTGQGVCFFRLLPIEVARAHVPAGFAIVSVLPGKTVGALYLASYQTGSTLQYHELIVIPALVRRQARVGAWISHIYVDDSRSQAGGREIWGLPKELAQFAVTDRSAVTVSQDQQVLCRLQWQPRRPAARLPVVAPAFGMRHGHPLWFNGRGSARVSRAYGRIEIPPASPFAMMAEGSSAGILGFERLDALVAAPDR